MNLNKEVRPAFVSPPSNTNLTANYFHVQVPDSLELYWYTITIADVPRPPKPGDGSKESKATKASGSSGSGAAATSSGSGPVGRKRKRIVKLFLDALPDPAVAVGNPAVVSDLADNLICNKEVELKASPVRITYTEETKQAIQASKTLSHHEQQYDVSIAKLRLLKARKLLDYLRSTDITATFPDEPQEVWAQAFNIWSHHASKVDPNTWTIGNNRSFTVRENPAVIRDSGLIWLPGFFSSVRFATARILLNVNVSRGVFYRGGDLAALMQKTLSGQLAPPSQATSRHEQLRKLNSVLRGVKVQVRSRVDGEWRYMVKTVWGLADTRDGQAYIQPAPGKQLSPRQIERNKQPRPLSPPFGALANQVKFYWVPNSNGPNGQGDARMRTVQEFWSSMRGVATGLAWPVINCGSVVEPQYFPVEACTVLPGQPYRLKLDPTQIQCFPISRPLENRRDITNSALQSLGLDATARILVSYLLGTKWERAS